MSDEPELLPCPFCGGDAGPLTDATRILGTWNIVDALRAERDEAIRGRDSWRDDYKALSAAIVGDTGLSAMTVATQARLFRPRAEAAEAQVAALTARVEGLTGAITFALSEYDAPNDIDEAMSKLRTELSKDAALSHNGRGE